MLDSLLSVTPVPAVILLFFFFFNDTATTEIYTLSLHDALPISRPSSRSALRSSRRRWASARRPNRRRRRRALRSRRPDRKSTRLNSSHSQISYAVFCLKKKKNRKRTSDSRNQNTESSNDT